MFLTIKTKVRFFILLMVPTLMLLLQVSRFNGPDMLIDDAFISFRYAVNWARGLGLVYNPGERVDGYTNFLWVILLGICVRLGVDIALASKFLALLSAVGTIAMLLLFQERGAPNRRDLIIQVIPALLFAAMGSQARYVVSGMETLLFTFLLSLAIYLIIHKNVPFLAGLAFAFLAMTRPEGVLYFVLALLYAIMKPFSLKSLLRFASAFVGLYGTYFLWHYFYYGYPLPNTFYAKVGGLYWIRIQRGWELLCRVLSWWSIWPILALIIISLSTHLFCFVKLRMPPLQRIISPINSWEGGDSTNRNRAFFFGVVILATVSYFIIVGGDFIAWFGPRFLIPVLPMLLLLSTDGLLCFSQIRPVPILMREALKFILFIALLINAWYCSWPSRFFNKEAFSVQMRGWAELGRWIDANTPKDATIATDAAGLIPFYSERYSIDMFGLTDLYIAHKDVLITKQSIVAHEKYDPQYILQRKPDYIVSTWMDSEGQAVSAGLPSVQEELNRCYKLIAVAKIRNGPPKDGRWVIALSSYSSNLYEQGYVTGLFQRQCAP